MNRAGKERLYYLLPAIYRLRDQSAGEPLRALMAGLEQEFHVVETDIDALYDNWFIETCDEWVIPYIADLIGVYSVGSAAHVFSSQRRQVANTLGYRRRRGVPAALEHVLQDVSGWFVRVLEYGRLLAVTQHLSSINTGRGRLADLRQARDLAELGGAFETTAHLADIRHIGTGIVNTAAPRSIPQGKYGEGNVGLFIWRLQSYQLKNVPARAVTRDATSGHFLPRGCFTFDPLGSDTPLFTSPQAVSSLTERVGPLNLPGPISRSAFADDLEEFKARFRESPQTLSEGQLAEEGLWAQSAYYGPERSLCIMLNGQPLSPGSIVGADLSQWNVPLQTLHSDEQLVAVDVALGRMLFLSKLPRGGGSSVEVNYCYGFSGDFGGGPYTRFPLANPAQACRINVLKGGKTENLRSALAQWEAYCQQWEAQTSPTGAPRCVIRIVDSGVYAENGLVINLPKNGELFIEAANGVRPVIGPFDGLTINSQHASAHLQLNGLLIDGRLDINGSLNLEVVHCTLMPHGLEASHSIAHQAPLHITIDHSVVGPIRLKNRRSVLQITDSVVDYEPGYAIDAGPAQDQAGPCLCLERVTVFGKVRVQEVGTIQDVIFTEPVIVSNQRVGHVSFSYVPQQSQTPFLDHCQPTLAAVQDAEEREQQGEREDVFPLFTSTRYGDPGYAQLDWRCGPRILRGASNGVEMGVFNSLRSVQRRDNISQMLNEYLPCDLTAGLFYVT